MGWKKRIAGGLAGLLLAGCVDDSLFDKEEKGDGKIQEEVVELQKEDLDNISRVSDNSITFNEAKDFEKGDIIIGGVSSQTPGGILRKVSNVSAGGKTIETGPASLEEVFDEEQFSYTHYLDYENLDIEKNLKSSEENNVRFGPSNKLKSTQKGRGFKVDLSKTVIYDLDGNENTTDDQVWIDGYIEIRPKYELDAEFKRGLKKFEFNPEISKEAHITVGGKLEKKVDHEITLTKANFLPVTLPGPGVPVVLRPKIELNAGIVGQAQGEFEVESSVLQNASLKLKYEDKNWLISKNYEKYFEFDEFEGQMNMDYYAYVNPRVTVVVNELVGPFVEMSGGLELYANTNDNPWWYLDGKIEANAGVDMNFLSFLIPEYNKNIYEYSKRIAQANGSFGEDGGEDEGNEDEDEPNENQNTKPNAYFAVNPKEGELDTEFMFNANATWDEQDDRQNMYYRWDFDGDGNWDENWEKGNDFTWHYYSQPGQYKARMQVKDLGDLVDSFEANVKVNRNDGPDEPEGEIKNGVFTDPIDGQEYEVMNVNGTWWFKENFNRYTKQSVYPEDDSIKNHEYGRLYTKEDATENCPAGWELPSADDFEGLINVVNPDYKIGYEWTYDNEGNSLRSKGTTYWDKAGGTDLIGFDARGAGFGYLPPYEEEIREQVDFFRHYASFWATNNRFLISSGLDFVAPDQGSLFNGKSLQVSVRYIKKED